MAEGTTRGEVLGGLRGAAAGWEEAPLPLPDLQAGEDAGPLDKRVPAAGPLEVRLVEDLPKVLLRVRTRAPEFNGRVLCYALLGGAGRQVSGFLVLRPDPNGWFTGHAA